MKRKKVLRWGFKSVNQLPLFMLWWEWIVNGQTEYARVIFATDRKPYFWGW